MVGRCVEGQMEWLLGVLMACTGCIEVTRGCIEMYRMVARHTEGVME